MYLRAIKEYLYSKQSKLHSASPRAITRLLLEQLYSLIAHKSMRLPIQILSKTRFLQYFSNCEVN